MQDLMENEDHLKCSVPLAWTTRFTKGIVGMVVPLMLHINFVGHENQQGEKNGQGIRSMGQQVEPISLG